MSYVRHDVAIVVVSAYKAAEILPEVAAFRASLEPKFRQLLVGPIATPVNGLVMYLFLPDGSGEGWDDSDRGDIYRGRFLDLFNECYKDGSTPFKGLAVTVRWGGDEPGAGQEPALQVATWPQDWRVEYDEAADRYQLPVPREMME